MSRTSTPAFALLSRPRLTLALGALLALSLLAGCGTSTGPATGQPTSPGPQVPGPEAPAPTVPDPGTATPAPGPSPAPTPTPMPTPAPTPDLSGLYTRAELLGMVRSLRVSGNDMGLDGAFRLAPGGRVNWYFSNLGLLPYVQELQPEVRAHLNAYLAFCARSGGAHRIFDVDFANPYTMQGATLVKPDSDDAYAGTFLRLAARYLRASGDRAWFTAHRAQLLGVADMNIGQNLKASGLPRVFQDHADGGGVGYLMDAAEAYAGLRDFVGVLQGYADPEAARLGALLPRMLGGIQGLRRPDGSWQVSDASPVLGDKLYPDAAAQIFPKLYGAATGDDAAGWATVMRLAPDWASSGQYDAFPWVMFSLAAAQRGHPELAARHLRFVRQHYPFESGLLTINELGFYGAALDVLQGKAFE